MDMRCESELKFLDLSNADDSVREELTAILKPNTATGVLKLPWDTGETEVIYNSTIPEVPEEQCHWQNYVEPEGVASKYGTHIDATHYVHTTMIQNMPSAQPIPPNDLIRMYSSWPQNMMVNNGMPNMNPRHYANVQYSHVPTSNECYDMHSGRGTGTRNWGRGMKKDGYNRGNIHSNDMQPRFTGEQDQFHQYYHQYPTPYYTPSDPTVFHPHHSPAEYHNRHGMPVHPGMVNYVHVMPPPQSFQFHPPSEVTKIVAPKTNEKRMHNTTQSTVQNITQSSVTKQASSQAQEEPQTQSPVVTAATVNDNETVPTTSNVNDSATSVGKYNGANEKLNVEIKHTVSTVKEDCEGTEKNDVPCVNISSSIEVKRNGENSKEYDDETVASIKTTVVTKVSAPTTKVTSNEAPEEISTVDIKTSEESIVVTSANEAPPTIVSASPLAASIKTWASLLKSGPVDSDAITSTNKPTARINPLNVNSSGDTINASVPETQQNVSKTEEAFVPKQEHEHHAQNVDNHYDDFKKLQREAAHSRFDDPIAHRMGEFLHNYQMDKQTVSLLPRGLTNRSNYCYINSILQALLACPPFYNLLIALPNSKHVTKNSATPLIDNMIKFAREFTPLSDGARLARKDRPQKRNEDAIVDIQCGVAFEPSYVYTMLKNTSSAGVFSVEGRQEDAEEFLSCLLNGLSDEMLELMKLVNNNQFSSEEIEPAVNYNNQGDQEEWQVMGPKNKGSITRCTEFGRTPLSDIFRGQLRSRVSRAGEQPTDNVQPFFTLQLDIEKAESVKGALDILVGKDPLEGMTCSKTKQQIEAWKQVSLEELPVILILHLKWFDYKLDGCSKICKSVEFPVDLKLDGKFLSPNTIKKLSPKQKQYKLFAVTYHDGKEATKGHYVTDAFHVGYGGWVRYDDSSLKGVSESNVLNPTPPRVPYLLYYRRCDTIKNNQSNSGKTR
ncbi:ubiquitin carboxyl-terminal hydrolase 10 [Cephus cinctus]|uniref:ubiquitinyl hydrolase 1 n=1 Tax=Cephus cinctus TaxID=211228 RepID=A0AAJ7BTV7_CEPCN|nr:ubiquitin carboxyl-terminal hydrolase 10 [Cephus cinctus]